jgi:membrane protease YdiL (CAAX protease family)/Pyruvate/2-oxoacid:ferredoxin oxidoreductase delta subunit
VSAETPRPNTKSAHLTLQPEFCTGCGECLKVCVPAAIRLSNAAVHVDWKLCNNCCECAAVCTPRAIQRAIVPLRSASGGGVAPADVPKLVVGSRAEAKALRKAAEKTSRPASPDRAAAPAGRGVFRKTGSARVAVAGASAAGAGAAAAGAVAGAAVAGAAAAGAVAGLVDTDTGVAADGPVGAETTQPAPAMASAPALGIVSWSLADTGLVLAVGLLAIVGKNAAMGIPAIGLMPAAARAMAHTGILTLYYAAQFAALSILAARHGFSVAVAFGLRSAPDTETRDAEIRRAGRPSMLTSAGLVVGLLVGVEAIAIGYGLAMTALGWRQPGTVSGDVSAVFGSGGAGLAFAGVLVALVAPVVEELAFRGVVMVALTSRMGVWPAMAIQAVLFAAYHASVWLFFPMLVFGVALGWLASSRRSLWPAIVLHVAYNGLAVAAAFLVPS